MQPVEFKGANVVYGKDQKEYSPLPAMKMPDGQVVTCWQMTEEEFEEITKTRKVYLTQLTGNGPLQPVCLVANLEDLPL